MAIITQQRHSHHDELSDGDGTGRDLITGDYKRLNNLNPQPHLHLLLPVATDPISVRKLKDSERLTAHKLLEHAAKLGMNVEHLPFRLYSSRAQGESRDLANVSLAKGYPMYGKTNESLQARLKAVMEARSRGIALNNLIMEAAAKLSEPVKFDEWDDAKKFTIQRTRMKGRHLVLPAHPDLVGITYQKRFMEILDLVIDRYITVSEGHMPPRSQVMELITDAKETNVGGPSFASGSVDEHGYDYNQKRIITETDAPPPNYAQHPSEYLSNLYTWCESLGFPIPAIGLSSMLSWRQGAKGSKPQPLWDFDGSSWVAHYEGVSIESNQRVVHMSPHIINLILTPLVYQMKYARYVMPGLFHNPNLLDRNIQALNKQGSISYESDFSTFDLTISNALMVYIYRTFAKRAKKYAWEFEFFANYIEQTGVAAPSYVSDSHEDITFLQHGSSLLSGLLPTSETGSIVSITANLYALEKQIPNIVNLWLSGKFIILVQSDDVLFTLDKTIDEELFTFHMLQCGLKAKLKQGNMFLKKLLPVGTLRQHYGRFPVAGVPLWSRQIQQTLFNEKSYEGKPDVITRLGLLSRSEGLDKHPLSSEQLVSAWKDFISGYDILRPVVDVLFDGVLALSHEDKAELLNYSESEDGAAWLSQLMNRADADPKARATVEELAKLGIDLSKFQDTSVSQRRAYVQALYSKPSADSRSALLKIAVWN